MKTIKRTLLSIILLQAVCQPISAISFNLETVSKATVSFGLAIEDALLSQAYKIKDAITSYPFISVTTFISLIIGLDYFKKHQQNARIAANLQARKDFEQYINSSAQQYGKIDLTDLKNQNFYKRYYAKRKVIASVLEEFISEYNDQPTDGRLARVLCCHF